MASFTDIVKEQRSQGAGVFGSLGKATGQRTLERIDPRNYLFNRNGLAAALFPGLKGFQAKTGTTSKLNEASSSSLSSGQANSLASRIEDVAKNTFVLPGMARDMNVMRQNIIKLVRLGGGKPSNKAMSTKQRQEAYESQFGKKSQSPTQIGKKDDVEKKSGNWFSNLIDFLFSAKGLLSLGILAGLGKLLENEKFRATMIEWVGGFFKAIFNGIAVTADFLGTILTDPAVVESIKNMFSHLFDLAKKIAFLPVGDIEILGHKFTVNLLEAVLGSMAVWFGTKGAMTAMGSILMKSIAGDAIGAAAGGLISRALITALGVALSPEVLVGLLIAAVTGGIVKYFQDDKNKKMIDEKIASNQTGPKTQSGMGGIFKEYSDELKEKSITKNKSSSLPELKILGKTVEYPGGPKKPSPTPTPESTKESTTPTQQTGDDVTFNSLTTEQQDALLSEQRNQEGFKPGTVSYDLNNPGNILYTNKAKEFGGVRDTTGRGVDDVKGKFAKFPTLADGIEAQRDLWSRIYGDMPLKEAIAKWSPDATNNYARQIFAAINKPMPSGDVPIMVASNNNTGRSVNQQSSFIADAKIFNPTDMMASAFSDMNSLLSALGGNLSGSQNITSINSQLAAANPYDTDMVKLFLESFA